MAESTLKESTANSETTSSTPETDVKEQSILRPTSPVSCCPDPNVPKHETSGGAILATSVSPSDTASLSSCSHEERDTATNGTATASTTATPKTQSLVLPEESEALLRRLARQLEYYFSRTNLSKDMYLQTLRELNDGYVPVTILANFGKVQALVSYESVNAVIQAVKNYSESLEVVSINMETRKRVVDDENESLSAKKKETLLAVGPVRKEPLDIDDTVETPSITPFVSPTRVANVVPITPTSQSSVDGSHQNTVILRDVPSDVTEEQVRALFDFECPPIVNVYLDVASCWFVSFDTTSRNDMISIMFALKSKHLPNGEALRARLKAAPAATSVMTAGAPVLPMMMPSIDGVAATGYSPNLGFNSDDLPCPPSPRSQHRRPNGKRARKTNKTAKQPSANSSGASSTNSSSNNSKPSSQKNRTNRVCKQKAPAGAESDEHRTTPYTPPSSLSISSDEVPTVVQQPPVLADDHFPALGDVVVVNTDEMKAEAEQANESKVVLEDTPSKSNSIADEDDDEDRKFKNNSMSDAASTATTTSSSSSSIPKAPIVMGAYAAALLKTPVALPTAASTVAATAKTLATASSSSVSKKVGDSGKNRQVVSKIDKDGSSRAQVDSEMVKRAAISKKDEAITVPAPVVITPPTWGRGRSFADVLRKAESGKLLTSSS